MEEVFRTDVRSLGSRAGSLIKDLSFGGLIGGGKAQSLLDATPLHAFLKSSLPFEQIGPAITRGHLDAVAVTATSYYSGKSYTFIQGRTGHPTWEKTRRISVSTPLAVEHICASSAIPVVFQPVRVATPQGDFYFGDGALRLITPLSPAIRLGADQVFAIGVRSQRAAEIRAKSELIDDSLQRVIMKQPPLAQVFGVILNAIFLDHLDADIEHLKRINDIVKDINPRTQNQDGSSGREHMRPVGIASLSPSNDLALLADQHSAKMSRLVRFFMEGLGTSKSESADLLSYLLFDGDYTSALIDLGYHDADEQIAELEEFFRASERRQSQSFLFRSLKNLPYPRIRVWRDEAASCNSGYDRTARSAAVRDCSADSRLAKTRVPQ